ncbi:MAG: hypothetical protein NT114_00870 [Patescibacteria group bacterium]|nr:hypothetical protein [Patescibacteria group bacterium]
MHELPSTTSGSNSEPKPVVEIPGQESRESHDERYEEGEAYKLDGYKVLNSLYYKSRLGDTTTFFDYANEKENSQNFRSHYIENTRQLIHEIVDKNIDTVIFLDKSGRPVQWLISELWPIFAADKKKPVSYFANIDAAEWCGLDRDSGVRPTDEELEEAKRNITDEDLEIIRHDFGPKRVISDVLDEHGEVMPGHKVATDEPLFDGKNVLIVDETAVTGATLDLAQFLFAKAFPKASFSGKHWQMNYKEKLNNPVWYSRLDVTGRGVGDGKAGSILSSRLESHDVRAAWLREDIKTLAKDIVEGKQWVMFHEEDPSLIEKDEQGNFVLDEEGRSKPKPVPKYHIRPLPPPKYKNVFG